jgi:NAD(P)-dependent dehydrogenase (short-subunit alcohol dehydrogenase family)
VLGTPTGAAQAVAEQINSTGGVAMAVPADIVEQVNVERALAEVRAQLGPVSVLVNNAAVRTSKDFAETTAVETDRLVGVAFLGILNVLRVALPDLLATQGRIVNVVPDSARSGAHSMSVYAGAGAAVVAVTKSLAREVGRRGVRANVVAFGTTVTPGDSSSIEQLAEAVESARAYPLGRLGTPADIAGAVLCLTSPLSAWITGQVLSVNGGYTMI